MTKTTIIYAVMMVETVVTMTMPIGMCLVHFVNALKAFANPLMVCNLKLFQLTIMIFSTDSASIEFGSITFMLSYGSLFSREGFGQERVNLMPVCYVFDV